MSLSVASRIKPIAVMASLGVLSGCAAVALVPSLVVTANSARDNQVKVSINEGALTSDISSRLKNAKQLGIAASDQSAIKGADVFENRGKYQVTIDRPVAKIAEMTGSERKNTLLRICSTVKPDIAMLSRSSRSATGNSMLTTFVGRFEAKHDWTMEMLSCQDRHSFQIAGQVEFDVGIINQRPQSEYEEAAGVEIVNKLLSGINR